MKKILSVLLALVLAMALFGCGSQNATGSTVAPTALHCTLTMDCITVLDRMDDLAENKKELIPSDGYLFSKTDVTFTQGETVYDLLVRVCKENKIAFDTPYTPAISGYYVAALGNLYEGDCGQLSGWMVCINGESPSVGIGQCELQEGQNVEFRYTCDMGADIGLSFS